MTDLFDQAAAIENMQREHALKAQAAKTANIASFSHCEECGEEIPKARREYSKGITRCVECQTEHERRNHLNKK